MPILGKKCWHLEMLFLSNIIQRFTMARFSKFWPSIMRIWNNFHTVQEWLEIKFYFLWLFSTFKDQIKWVQGKFLWKINISRRIFEKSDIFEKMKKILWILCNIHVKNLLFYEYWGSLYYEIKKFKKKNPRVTKQIKDKSISHFVSSCCKKFILW